MCAIAREETSRYDFLPGVAILGVRQKHAVAPGVGGVRAGSGRVPLIQTSTEPPAASPSDFPRARLAPCGHRWLTRDKIGRAIPRLKYAYRTTAREAQVEARHFEKLIRRNPRDEAPASSRPVHHRADPTCSCNCRQFGFMDRMHAERITDA